MIRRSIVSSALTLGLLSSFSNMAQAQEHRCAALDILQYDLKKEGLTLQSSGDISISGDAQNKIEGHRFEFHANPETGHWKFMEIKGGEQDSCFTANGTFFVHEPIDNRDGQKTQRQSITALHGGGDSGNEAYEIFAHEGSGRWFLTRRVSAIKSDIILAGSNFAEENRTFIPRATHISYQIE